MRKPRPFMASRISNSGYLNAHPSIGRGIFGCGEKSIDIAAKALQNGCQQSFFFFLKRVILNFIELFYPGSIHKAQMLFLYEQFNLQVPDPR